MDNVDKMDEVDKEDGTDLKLLRAKVNAGLWSRMRAHFVLSGAYPSIGKLYDAAFRDFLRMRENPDFEKVEALARSRGEDVFAVIDKAFKRYLGE